MTVYIEIGRAREVQDYVKKTNGRFMNNPLKLTECFEFKVEFDQVEDLNMFSQMLNDNQVKTGL
jgi:hypothetical protein